LISDDLFFVVTFTRVYHNWMFHRNQLEFENISLYL
jgi:hypothetical protein